jgi:hypothetical protein
MDVLLGSGYMVGNPAATSACGLGSRTAENESRSNHATVVRRWLIRCLLYSGLPVELERNWAGFDEHALQWLARSFRTAAIVDPAQEAALDRALEQIYQL